MLRKVPFFDSQASGLTFESGRRFTVEEVSRYWISQLAQRSGVPATTLRYYESAGLLPAERTESGYRVYGEHAVERLGFIRAAKHVGLPLDEIRELLSVWEQGACADFRARLRPMMTARMSDVARRRADLESFAETLRAALAHLDAQPERIGSCELQCGCVPSPSETERGTAPAATQVSPVRWGGSTSPGDPVACSLNGDEQRVRVQRWRQAVADADREPIPDGVRLTLPGHRAGTVAELAAAEQQCCPFVDFRLSFDSGRACLEVRAPAHASPLVTELFGTAESPSPVPVEWEAQS